jgi:hypothetical protein
VIHHVTGRVWPAFADPDRCGISPSTLTSSASRSEPRPGTGSRSTRGHGHLRPQGRPLRRGRAGDHHRRRHQDVPRTGELFFASSNDLVYQFDYTNDPERVVVDMSGAHIWDASSVAALDAITTKYAARGKQVEIVGLDEASASFHENLAGKLGAGH